MTEVLIAAVYKREPLWNPSSKLYKNVPVIKSLWNEVAHEVNKDEKTIRTKWKNLRTYFYRELRKIEKLKSGEPAEDVTSTWQFFNQMMFLNDKVSFEQQYSNLTQCDDSDNSREEESQDEMIQLLSPISTSNSSAVEQNTRPKKKIKYMSTVAQHDEQILELERRKLEIIEKESADSDDDLLFFQSLLPYMKQIPSIRKLRLRSIIQDLILQQLDGK